MSKEKKLKTYVLTVSRTFPTSQKKAGKPTFFVEKIEGKEKKHTIRLNYDLWKKRIDEVNEGKAIVSLRHWTGRPYNSPQKTVKEYGKGEIGIQKLQHRFEERIWEVDELPKIKSTEVLAKNDGLEWGDFIEWFSPVSPDPYAIIHFTDFRY